MTQTQQPDKHGNVLAEEGCTRCPCGAKYWEHDVCVSCGVPYLVTFILNPPPEESQ